MENMFTGYMPTFPGMEGDFGTHKFPKPMHGCLVKVIQDCEATCEHTGALLKRSPDVQMRVRQLMLLHDCADICGLTAKFIARKSMFSRHCAHLCAMICEVCGNECARFPDAESQHCAQVCMHCARECQAFAGMSHMM